MESVRIKRVELGANVRAFFSQRQSKLSVIIRGVLVKRVSVKPGLTVTQK